MTTSTHHKLIIIGSGPAGLSAAIHTARTKLAPVVITGTPVGGALIRSKSVGNWPGITAIPGADLIQNMYDHATHCGAQFVADEVTQVALTEQIKTITLASGIVLTCDALIIACGGKPKNLDCSGAKQYWNKGVFIGIPNTLESSWYVNKTIAVIGGGNSGIGVAGRLLAAQANVIIVHPKATLAANDPSTQIITQNTHTTLLLGYTPFSVDGNDTGPTTLIVHNPSTQEQKKVSVDAIMVTIGSCPNTALFVGQLAISAQQHIVVEPGTTVTTVPGVFAAGDVMDSRYRHAITSSGQGFMAGIDAENYLKRLMAGIKTEC